MKLPDDWIDRLMARMATRYGAAWLRMWEGVPIADVKEDWAEGLGGLWKRPEALKFGMDNLPDTPPNMQQFRAICSRCPERATKALPAPPVDPVVVAKARDRLLELQRRLRNPDRAGPNAVDQLLKLESSGQKLTAGQRGFLDAALAASKPNEAELFDAANFRPIPPGVQPEGSDERAAAEFFASVQRMGRGHMPMRRAQGGC